MSLPIVSSKGQTMRLDSLGEVAEHWRSWPHLASEFAVGSGGRLCAVASGVARFQFVHPLAVHFLGYSQLFTTDPADHKP